MLYSDVEANSVLLLVADDDTTSTVSPTRRGGHEKTHGMRDRRRNVYVSLEVWMLWLGFLTSITIVHGCLLRVVNSGIHAPHPLDLRGVIIKPPKPLILLNFEHLKHRGPCRQRPLSSLELKALDLNSTIPLAIAAVFLAEVIMYLNSQTDLGPFVVLLRKAQTDLAIVR